ncbi:MAG: pyridoxamine 5'-phosphate oxidase family protein [Acidimicrobiales bacterium]
MSVRLSEEEVWAFLEAGHTGIVTTLRADGWPVSLPVWYVVLDQRIYVMTPAHTRKVARIRADERACFLVERGEAWTELAAVELAVRASIVATEAEEVATALSGFAAKYAAYRPAPVRLPKATTKHYSTQAVIRLDPIEPALSWDNARIRLATGNKETTDT